MPDTSSTASDWQPTACILCECNCGIVVQLEGRTLLDSGIRKDHGVNVVAVKHLGGRFTDPSPQTVLEPGSLVLVAGDPINVERFASLD